MSALPAIGIAVVGLMGLALLFAGTRAARRARPSDGQHLPILAAVLFGFGVFCLLVAGNGFRHFGGFTEVGQGARAYRCDAWWAQMRSTAGATDGDDLPSHECRQAAVRAILPTIGESAVGGAVGALVAYPVVILRRRRFNQALERVVISSNWPPDRAIFGEREQRGICVRFPANRRRMNMRAAAHDGHGR